MKRINLFSTIYDYTAEKFANDLSAIGNEDVEIYLRSDGGYTSAGVAMLMALSEHKGKKNMTVAGDTYSMGAEMLVYADYVKMNEMAKLMFHKSAFPSWYEPTPDEQAMIKQDNEMFKQKMIQKIAHKGIKAQELIDKIYEPDVRNDVYLTAQEAMDAGLVDEIITINVGEMRMIDDVFSASKSNYEAYVSLREKQQKKNNTDSNTPQKKTKIMTKEELFAQYPDLCKAIQDQAVTAERDRVGALMMFHKADPAKVETMIKEGKAMSQTDQTELLIKLNSVKTLESLKTDSAGDINTDDLGIQDGSKPEMSAREKAEIEAYRTRKFL